MLSARTLLALALVMPDAASAADTCRWYVNRQNPDNWIELVTDREIAVHNPMDGDFFWKYRIVGFPGPADVHDAVFADPQNGVLSAFSFRFSSLDGRLSIVANSAVFDRTCVKPDFAPAPA